MQRSRSVAAQSDFPTWSPAAIAEWLIGALAPCPWTASVGASSLRSAKTEPARKPLYSREERARRDRSPWTLVQAVLAPLQFLVFAVSLVLVVRTLGDGQGAALATASVLLKTGVLYAIMVTGAIWEKEVFGRYLFAKAFFWEDVMSMLVLALHTAYVVAILFDWGSTSDQLWLALAAYASYVVNAGQFVWKLRLARLDEAAAAGT